MTAPFDRERELCLLAARPELTPAEQSRAAELLAAEPDWPALLETLEFHLLTPAFLELLEKSGGAPPALQAQVRMASIQAVARNMQLTGAAFRWQEVLESRGIPVLTIKGPVLAVDAYGALNRRPFYDVDLLVRRADARQTIEVLSGLGLQAKLPMQGTWPARFVRRFYEISFSDSSSAALDLHWSLMDTQFSFCPTEQETWADPRTIAIDGQALKTLSENMTARYLCLHVAKHHWDRLGWLADVAWWSLRRPEFDWRSLVHDPTVGPFVLVTLGLIDRLLERRLLPDIQDLVARDPRIAASIQSVEARMLRQPGYAVTMSAEWRTEFGRLMPRTSDRWKSCFSTLFQPSLKEWLETPLPEALSPLYAVIRPWRLLRKRLLPNRQGESAPDGA